MSFKESSGWNEKTELEAYRIFRILLEKNFPRGMQSKLCEEMSKNVEKLDKGNISAKVSNYKSEAGINKRSHSSSETKTNYLKYKEYTIEKIEKIISKL